MAAVVSVQSRWPSAVTMSSYLAMASLTAAWVFDSAFFSADLRAPVSSAALSSPALSSDGSVPAASMASFSALADSSVRRVRSMASAFLASAFSSTRWTVVRDLVASSSTSAALTRCASPALVSPNGPFAALYALSNAALESLSQSRSRAAFASAALTALSSRSTAG